MVYHCKLHGDTKTTINAKNICKDYFLPCKQCQRINKSEKAQGRKNDKEFYYDRLQEYCKSRGGEVLSKEWTTAKAHYEFKCSNPSHPIFISMADGLIEKNAWCPYCCGRCGNFEDEIRDIVESKNGVLLSEYINANKHVSVKCNKHNFTWDIMPLNIRKGRWCPICNLPFSEKVVWDYLKANNVNVRTQYKFSDLQGKNNELLKYDFAILDKDNQLKYVIEIDDCEHKYKGKSQRRVNARLRDKVKDEYCINHKIPLFRMDYPYSGKPVTYEEYFNYINEQLINIIKDGEKI